VVQKKLAVRRRFQLWCASARDLLVILRRLMNLELLLKFGPTAWKVQNAWLEAHNSRCEADVADTCASVVNKCAS